MRTGEEPIEWVCSGNRVYGVVHTPGLPLRHGLVVIGRTGSDRQAVHLCRGAARAGIPALRFDFRGRGWCEGPLVQVEETGEDLACAIRAFQSTVPGLATFTIFGLSEGGAAAVLYAWKEPRVTGIVAVNPWVRLDQEVAKQHLKKNVARIGDREFWKRIRRSESGYLGAARSLARLIGNYVVQKDSGDLKQQIAHGLSRFEGKVCIIFGGEDPATIPFMQATADQIRQLTASGRLSIHTVPDADHVFSGSESRQRLIAHSVNWALERSSESELLYDNTRGA